MIGLDVILAKPDGKPRGDGAATDDAETGATGAQAETAEGWIEALNDASGAPEVAPDDPLAIETATGAPNAPESFIFRQDVLVAAPPVEGEATEAANPTILNAEVGEAAPIIPVETPKVDAPIVGEADAETPLADAPEDLTLISETPPAAVDIESAPIAASAEAALKSAAPTPAIAIRPADAQSPIASERLLERQAPTEISAPTAPKPAIQAAAPTALAAQTQLQPQRPQAGPDLAPEQSLREARRREPLSSEALASIRKEYGGAAIAPVQAPEVKAPTPPTIAAAPQGLADVLALNANDAAVGAEEVSPIGKLEAATISRGAAAERALFAPASPQIQAQAGAIAAQIRVAFSASNSGRIDIRLDPPELGRLSVTISAQDDISVAIVNAERPEVVDILRRHGDMLTRDLEAAGFANLSLEFASSGEGEGADDDSADGDAAPQTDTPRDSIERSLSVAAAGDRLDIRL